jgi:hypothetical protein
MSAAATLALILAGLQVAQQAVALYNEIKPTLSADDQATVDAEIAKLFPQEQADEAQAEADLKTAAAE